MKYVRLDPASCLAGAALAGLVALLLGAAQQRGNVQQITSPRPGLLHVAGIPDPNDMILIRQEDGPYTVPLGKLFVLTSLGHANPNGSNVSLNVNSAVEAFAYFFPNASNWANVLPIPERVFSPGSVLGVFASEQEGRATGYLADVRP